MLCSIDITGRPLFLRDMEEELIWERQEVRNSGRHGGREVAVTVYCVREEYISVKHILRIKLWLW